MTEPSITSHEPLESNPSQHFLSDVQRELARINRELNVEEASVDLLFLAYLLKTSRFGFFSFGPITIDVRLVED
ncbi:MAG: hypothetical protein WBO97_05460, partial [Tepidiformaceae bacterium]